MFNMHYYADGTFGMGKDIFPEFPQWSKKTEDYKKLLRELEDLFNNHISGVSKIVIENDEFGWSETCSQSMSPQELYRDDDYEITEKFLTDNKFEHRSDDTWLLSFSTSQQERYVYAEYLEKDKQWWFFIKNTLSEMKTHLSTIGDLRETLKVCGFKELADKLQTYEG